MSASQKVALAVVVLLGMCFVAAVVVQSRGGEGGNPGDDSAQVFRGLTDDPVSVDRADLEADCFEGDRLVFAGDCTLTVAASQDSIRIVRLLPDKRVDIEAPAPQIDDFTIEAELEPGKEIPIAIDEAGGEIDLDCEAADCSVQWVSGAGK